MLNWKRNDDTTQGYEVSRATRPEGPFKPVATWTDSTRCEYKDSNVAAGTPYFYVVAALNQAGKSVESSPASATPAASGGLPPEWAAVNIGSSKGSKSEFAEVAGGSFEVSGAGAGIGGSSDGACFTNRSITGDVTLTARITEVQWGHSGRNAKVGIMMRASLDAAAPALFMKLGDLGVRQAGLGTRVATNGQMTWTGGNDYTWLPAWFRLERRDDTFTASESSDGVAWFPVGTSRVPMGSTCLIGLAVTSNSDEVCTVCFDHVSVQRGK